MYNGPGGNKGSSRTTRHIPRRELPAGARFTSAEDRSVLARPSAGQESARPAGEAPAMKEGGGPPPGDWVRPDLNRSRQHPKLVGFPVGRNDARRPSPNQATPRTRGATRRTAAVKTLPWSSDQSAERKNLVDSLR